MANLRKKYTALSVNLWIDGGRMLVYGGHWERLKFQGNISDKINTDLLFPIDLDGNIYFNGREQYCELNSKKINEIKNFIKNNRFPLEKILNKELDLKAFQPYFIKGGKLANDEELKWVKGKVLEMCRNLNESKRIRKPKFIREGIDENNPFEDMGFFSVLGKIYTGLNATIWIDEGSAYKHTNHGVRVKLNVGYFYRFLNDRDDLVKVDLDGNVYSCSAENEKRWNITDDDFQALKNYLKNNEYALQKIADNDIFFDDIFPYMIKGGEIATENEKRRLKEKTDEFYIED